MLYLLLAWTISMRNSIVINVKAFVEKALRKMWLHTVGKPQQWFLHDFNQSNFPVGTMVRYTAIQGTKWRWKKTEWDRSPETVSCCEVTPLLKWILYNRWSTLPLSNMGNALRHLTPSIRPALYWHFSHWFHHKHPTKSVGRRGCDWKGCKELIDSVPSSGRLNSFPACIANKNKFNLHPVLFHKKKKTNKFPLHLRR